MQKGGRKPTSMVTTGRGRYDYSPIGIDRAAWRGVERLSLTFIALLGVPCFDLFTLSVPDLTSN